MTASLEALRDIPANGGGTTGLSASCFWLLLEAFVLLGVAGLAMLIPPFRRLARWLGKHMRERESPLPFTGRQLTRMTVGAVRSAANCTPWEGLCLP